METEAIARNNMTMRETKRTPIDASRTPCGLLTMTKPSGERRQPLLRPDEIRALDRPTHDEDSEQRLLRKLWGNACAS